MRKRLKYQENLSSKHLQFCKIRLGLIKFMEFNSKKMKEYYEYFLRGWFTTHSKVKLGIHLLTEEKVAIKILCKQRIRERTDIERISRQIKIMKVVNHPFIVQMYEIIESPKYLFLIMQFVEGGDLFDVISNQSKLSEETSRSYYAQMVLGLQYLHKLGITHRDMKPQNILIA